VKATFLPHAREQMSLRGVSSEEVVETIRSPDSSYVGRFGRIVSEKDLGTRVLRVIYNVGQDEAVVISAVPIRKIGGGR
jgi:Domain of unknown function (DUF4258)